MPIATQADRLVMILRKAGIARAVVMTYVDAPGDFGDYDPIAYVADDTPDGDQSDPD